MFTAAKNLLKKLHRLLLWIPVLVLVLGLSLSGYIYRNMDRIELNDQRAESLKRSKEIIQSLDLRLSNSILRVQSYEEYIGSLPQDYRKVSPYLGQVLKFTVFQMFSVFRYEVAHNGTAKLRFVSSVETEKPALSPLARKDPSWKYVLSAMDQLTRSKGYSRTVLHEIGGEPLFTYVLKSRVRENTFFTFTAPLTDILDKTELRVSENIDIEDDETGRAWSVSVGGKGKDKIIRALPEDHVLTATTVPMQRLVFGDPPEAALNFYFHFNFQPPHNRLPPSVIMGAMSVLITLTISYLFWVLIAQNRLVSRLVIEKTHALEQAHQQLHDALIAKTRFLGSVSHEIRTPLNLILGMIDMCFEKDTDKKIQEYLTSMRSSGNHLLSMIEDLLDLAKAETNELQVQPKRFNLIQFLSDVVKLAGRDGRKKGLHMYAQLAADLPTAVNTDPSRLRQILLNLLRNANKYTNQGHVALKVSVLERPRLGIATLRFEVSDTGIGIHKDKIQKIFDAFFQVENAALLYEGGVGLGLAIVRELVQKLNGRLQVQSEPGKGSTFLVDLDLEVLDEKPWIESFRAPQDESREVILVSANVELKKSLQPLAHHTAVAFFHFSTVVQMENHCTRSAAASRCILFDGDGTFTPAEVLRLHRYGSVTILGDKAAILAKVPTLQDPILDSSPLLPVDVLTMLGFSSRIMARAKAAEGASAALAEGASIPDALNVLIADDDIGNQELYKAYFADKRWNINYALNGQEALDLYLKSPVDVVILDVRMPVMDGFEAAEKIRTHELANSLPHRPILLVTADAVEDTMKKAGTIQNLRFLTKPVRKSQLMESIAAVLK